MFLRYSEHMQDARIMNTLGALLGVGLTVADESEINRGANSTLDALDKAKKEAMKQMEDMSKDTSSQSNNQSNVEDKKRQSPEENMDTNDNHAKVEERREAV